MKHYHPLALILDPSFRHYAVIDTDRKTFRFGKVLMPIFWKNSLDGKYEHLSIITNPMEFYDLALKELPEEELSKIEDKLLKNINFLYSQG